MKTKFVALIIIACLLVPVFASADVIMPGYKEIDYCFKISNIDNYSEYTFIMYINVPLPTHEIIKQGECVDFYKLSSPRVFAIKSSDFDESKIDSENEQTYFESNFDLIPSDVEIDATDPVKKSDCREKVVEVFEVVSLSDDGFEMRKAKTITTFTDGTTEETYSDQETDSKLSEKSNSSWWIDNFWYWLVPLIALAIIIIIVLSRKCKR